MDEADPYPCTLMPPRYPTPWKLALQVAWAVLKDHPRHFRPDAVNCVSQLVPPLLVQGRGNIPVSGPYLFTVNHYSRPGFKAWWVALAASAAVPCEIHWVVTAAWTFPGRFYAGPLRPASAALFRRLARVYGFTTMPPMPPDPEEVQARAHAVRAILNYARHTPGPVIGIAPEGQDYLGGVLGLPPPGLGRFISLLIPNCRQILPAGLYEEGESLCLCFGEPYRLEVPAGLAPEQRDEFASREVMSAIARQLPQYLRGAYA